MYDFDYIKIPKDNIKEFTINERFGEHQEFDMIAINPIFEKESQIKTKSNGDKKEMKILDIYERKQIEMLNNYINKKSKEIIKNSVENKIKEKYYKKINEELMKECPSVFDEEFTSVYIEINSSKETKEKMQDLEKENNEKFDELKEKIKEIKALLDIAENYEQKISILKAYKIINKNNVMNNGENKNE